jgi:hypothetical protein
MRLTLRSRAAFPGRPRPTGMVIRQQDREEWTHRPIRREVFQNRCQVNRLFCSDPHVILHPLLEVPMKAVH